MRINTTVSAIAALLALAGCASTTSTAGHSIAPTTAAAPKAHASSASPTGFTTPDVTGMSLDTALSTANDQNFNATPESAAGKPLDINSPSDWTVCHQTPAAGAPTTSNSLILTVADVDNGEECAGASVKPSPAPKADTVTFVVTGTRGADVQYGSSGSNSQGHVPMSVTKKLGHPLYYSISAQLQGSGKVTCKLEINGKAISTATASGGYNIAMCEMSQDPLTGDWTDTNQG